MPNGGSDCCGTCWFNTKNKGQAGHPKSFVPGPAFCEIRGLEIPSPGYTYCANHPYRRQERDRTPIGPVMTGDSSGRRKIWKRSPDTEEIRRHLLAVLSKVKDAPEDEYPIGPSLETVVIWQLAELREARAVPDLERIAVFSPDAKDRFGVDRNGTILAAKSALLRIAEGEDRQQ